MILIFHVCWGNYTQQPSKIKVVWIKQSPWAWYKCMILELTLWKYTKVSKVNLAGNFYCKYKGCFVERPPTAISDKRTIGIFKLKENRKKFDSELLIFSHFLCFSRIRKSIICFQSTYTLSCICHTDLGQHKHSLRKLARPYQTVDL